VVSPSEVTEKSSASGELVALSVQTGAVLWRAALSAAPYGGTTVVNDIVFATTVGGELLAFSVANGHELWRETLPDGTNGGVMAAGATLLAPAGFPIKQGDVPQLVALSLPGAL
jgi:outer membrane protein assembly factor BamB